MFHQLFYQIKIHIICLFLFITMNQYKFNDLFLKIPLNKDMITFMFFKDQFYHRRKLIINIYLIGNFLLQ